MNNCNCPKCGNPLQIGITSCPICGTNISKKNEGEKPQVANAQGTNSAPTVQKVANPSSQASNQSPRPVAQTKQVNQAKPASQSSQAPGNNANTNGQARPAVSNNQAQTNATANIYASNPKVNPVASKEPAVQTESASTATPVETSAPTPAPVEAPAVVEAPTPVAPPAPAKASTPPTSEPAPNQENVTVEASVKPEPVSAPVSPTPTASPNNVVPQAPSTQAQNVVVGSVSTPQQTNQVLIETPSEATVPTPNNQVSPENVQVQASTEAPVTIEATEPEQPTAIKPLTVPVDPATVPSAPAVEAITPNTPIPGIPASLNIAPSTENAAPITAPKAEQAPVKKKTLGKTPLIICIVAAVAVVVGGIIFAISSNSGKQTNLEPKQNEIQPETTSVISNGYKLDLPKEWSLNEDGNNVVITNSSDSVIIKLSESSTPITEITKETIEQQLSMNTVFINTDVTTTQISARDAYVVNTTYNIYPTQIYFISANTSLTLGVTIIYQSEESKTKYESNVLELISTITYNDNSVKAIDAMGMYGDIFNMFNNVVTNQQPATPETPENTENPETPAVNQPEGEGETPVENPAANLENN